MSAPRGNRRPRPHNARRGRKPNSMLPRYLSLQQAALAENIRRFAAIHKAAQMQQIEELLQPVSSDAREG